MTSWETEEANDMADDKEYGPIEFGDTLVEDLPPSAGSLYAEVIGRLIELSEESEVEGWLEVKTGGRVANSVQTGLQGAARSLGVKIKTRTRPNDDGGKDVWVAIDSGDDEAEADDSGDEE